MYHYHILTRDKEETIRKIYTKQKEDPIKGDWFKLLQEDFKFIDIDMDEEKISETYKSTYKKKIKVLINKAVFKFFMNIKETHSKLDEVTYSKLETQIYLTSSKLKTSEKELLFNMRSKCHDS